MRLPSIPKPICLVAASFAALLALGCETGGTSGPSPTGDAQGDFVSDDPARADEGGSDVAAGSSGAGGGGGGGSPDPDDAEKAIVEADIIQVHAGKLYARSEYSGLSIIDVSVKDELELLGRYDAHGVPFEMYFEDGIVYAMFSSFPQYVWDEDIGGSILVDSSRVEALDVSDPTNITQVGSFDLPGMISDSRIVGDVLYTVSFESGGCYGCLQKANTTVTSILVADPASIAVVDRVTYEASDESYEWGFWRRSVSVTPDRMYVGGVEWDGWSSTGHSTIQVIDISDPAGDLVPGASVEVAGQIESRWQMDEHEGVLRVISQPGEWDVSQPPMIQTFSVLSANDIQPLGATPMVLPQPEDLRAVRFDGPRAFAITFEQTDPLFTIDLSDPANPKQVGELVIPGWVYHMVPRGDRLLGLGFDQGNPNGSLNVSIFDVSDLTAPTMLTRVAFGGDWSAMAEDQDRIHKAFHIDDALGTIFVPYSGWNYSYADEYGCSSYESGIQIVDFTADTLTKRGVAGSRGAARRAFVHEDRLFAVSDEQVRTFDIADKDAPEKKAELVLASTVDQSLPVGDLLARLSADWWTTEARLDLVPLSDPARQEPLGSLDLASLWPGDGCYGSFYGARMFALGQHLVIALPEYASESGSTRLVTIDLGDPTAPQLAGNVVLPFPMNGYYGYYGYYGYGAVSAGDEVVQVGESLVFRLVTTDWGTYDGSYDSDPTETAELAIVDLSNPASPHLAASHPLPGSRGHGLLQVHGDVVLTSHYEPVAKMAGKVRFFIDRISLADPSAPAPQPSVNVPGSIVSFDAETGRGLTVDYERILRPDITDPALCWETLGADAEFQYDLDDDPTYATGTCSQLKKSFELVSVGTTKAKRLDSEAVPEKTRLGNALTGDDRGFFTASSDSGETRLLAVGGMASGELQIASVELSLDTGWEYPVAASGTRVVLAGYYPGSVSVVETSDLSQVEREAKASLDGWFAHVTVVGDQALCSMGPYGLESVDLGD
jgi:hypothetical protein